MSEKLRIRPMREKDIAAARKIFSLAFGTFRKVADPEKFAAECDYIGARRATNPEASFVAEMNGEVIGSNIASRWGKVAVVGPLTIRPDMWGRGFARDLMSPVMDCLKQWQTTHAGLCTFPHSTKHLHLYQQFGFWPRFLTANMSRPVHELSSEAQSSGFSEILSSARSTVLAECRNLTESVYPGLVLDREILAISKLGLGDTVLIHEAGQLAGLALCHCGAETEAGENTCYIKFAAVRSTGNAKERFGRLLDACDRMARSKGLSRVFAGVSLARLEAFSAMYEQGFRTIAQVVSMHRPNEAGYSRPGIWVIDDWR